MGCFSPEFSPLVMKMFPAAVSIHVIPLDVGFSLQPSGVGMMPIGVHTKCYLPKSVGKVVRWWGGLTKKSSLSVGIVGWEFSSETCFIGKYRNWYVLTRWHVWSKQKGRDPLNRLASNAEM